MNSDDAHDFVVALVCEMYGKYENVTINTCMILELIDLFVFKS
jgi:hypothetical protein